MVVVMVVVVMVVVIVVVTMRVTLHFHADVQKIPRLTHQH